MLNVTPRTHDAHTSLANTLYHQGYLNAEILARILGGRGLSDVEELSLSLSELLPSGDLRGLDRAVAHIDWAIDNQKFILVVGDFDCDGATSTALVVRVLREMGARVDFLVPDRFKFGYGLTPALTEYAYARFSPDLIITVDNGISSHDGVAAAKKLGIDVVITDHHLTTITNPDALAVVNPNQLHCEFESKSLVGVGVAFYVMGTLARVRRQANKSTTQVSKYLDLVALGTVADVGFLDKNNKILVNAGLNLVRQGRCVPAILAILNRAGRQLSKVTASDFGFAIAPRINAAGRMDNMRIGVECLLADDMRVADELAYQLEQLNIERRSVEQTMKDTAKGLLQTLHLDDEIGRGIVLYQDDWHQGVIGIVAGRIKEERYLPTIIFAPADIEKVGDDDLIKGSARSVAGVHIRDVILSIAENNPELICYFGGHAAAAGLTIYKKNFEKFKQKFLETLSTFDQKLFSPTQYSDGQLMPIDVSLQFAQILESLTIWGHGFELPCFDGVFEVAGFKVLKEKHLKLSLLMAGVQYPIDAIWFNFDVEKWDYRASLVHVLYELSINEWQGSQKVQFIIKDLAVEDIVL